MTPADLNPEQVREWAKKAEWATSREASRMGKSGYAPKKAQLAEQVVALSNSWLAQGEALAAAREWIQGVADDKWLPDLIRREARAALASLSNSPTEENAQTDESAR
jgi:hypothetical protein